MVTVKIERMKHIIILFVFGVFVLSGISCHDVTVGYLLTEDASYNPDTMVVKSAASLDVTPPTLQEVENPEYYEMIAWDPEFYTPELLASWGIFPTMIAEIGAGEDYQRAKWEQPWVGNPIEGVQGTPQIYVTIKSIHEENGGDVTAALEQIKVYGDGTFEVPVMHTIPVGRYVISLNFSNEGYSKDLDDCFTIIVK